MEKRSSRMNGERNVNLFLSIICLALMYALVNDCAKSGNELGFVQYFLILVISFMGLAFSVKGLSCMREAKAIFFLSATLNNEYTPFQPKNKLPKDFEEFKKKFKKTNFLDFYTAEVRMDDFEYIHVRFKDKNDNLTDNKVISATDFCRYFQVIE